MGIQYKYHERYPESILVRNFVGRVTVEDVIDSWDYLLEKNMINDKLKGVINDLLGCELEMNLLSFHRLIDYLRQKEALKQLKLAVISDSPKTVVFPTIGQQLETDLKIKPFFTEEAAVQWIIGN